MRNKEGYTDTTPELAIHNIEQEEKTRRLEAYYKVYRGEKYRIKIECVSEDAKTYKMQEKEKVMEVAGVYPHIITLKDKKGICESFKWHDFFKQIVRLEK